MSGKSSKPGDCRSALEPTPQGLFPGPGDPEDPRLGDVIRRWDGGGCQVRPRQPVLLGFPCDEGVRRNHGRPGAALAPDAIRQKLYGMTSWDPLGGADQLPRPAPKQAPTVLTESQGEGVDLALLEALDLGSLRLDTDLEQAQDRLGAIVAELLRTGAVPVVLGGGHETAFGHFLGYVSAGLDCGIINVDAHLDVRPFAKGAHSGSPFRQAMLHPTHPLQPARYVVLGAQRQSVARSHWRFVQERQGRVYWLSAAGCRQEAIEVFAGELRRLAADCDAIFVTVDADAFRQGDVPASSAPSPAGLDGAVWPEIALLAGSHARVRSIEIVEVNPRFDRDEQSLRWAALGIRQFLVGLAARRQEAGN